MIEKFNIIIEQPIKITIIFAKNINNMKKLNIKATNNFWIDNGIVGLYKVINDIRRKSTDGFPFEIVLDHNELNINVSNETADVTRLLNMAKEEVVKSYLKKTDSVGWIFKNNIFEIYQKTDFKMHLKPFFAGKTPTIEGALLIPSVKDSDLGGKGRRMTNEEFMAFERFKNENSDILLNGKKIKLTGKGFVNSSPKYEIGEDFSESCIAEGKKYCYFSGLMVKKADVINGMNYPFLTGKSGEMNFCSQMNAKPLISSLYSIVSLFSFYNLNYLLQDDLKNYFILYDSNLKELSSFYNTIKLDISQLTKPDYCSFETELLGTTYENECFFNFLLSIYKQIKARLNKDKRKMLLFNKRVISMSNDGNIFNNVNEYTSLSILFELFDAFETFEEERNYFDFFVNMIRYFSKRLDSGKFDTTWRNRLCSDILSFRSIHKTIEWFLGEVKMKEGKGNIAFLDKIITIYNNKTQKDMKTEMVEICKSVGNRIGAYCREKDDKGILFSIRNAKSRTEFINVLAETQFRTEVSYSETFFKELPDNAQWEEYKALVSIFAMNSFLYKEAKQITKK